MTDFREEETIVDAILGVFAHRRRCALRGRLKHWPPMALAGREAGDAVERGGFQGLLTAD